MLLVFTRDEKKNNLRHQESFYCKNVYFKNKLVQLNQQLFIILVKIFYTLNEKIMSSRVRMF